MRLLLALLLLAPPAAAQSAWEMRVAGVPVGEATLTLSGSVLEGTARSTGIARAAGGYDWAARRSGTRYEEAERVRGEDRRTRLRLGSGVEVLEVPEGEVALDAALLRGAVDPVTAMVRLLRDRPAGAAPCALDVRFTDGVRLGRMTLAPGPDPLTCAGAWARLAGPPPADGRERRRSAAFAVVLVPLGDGFRVVEVNAEAPIGRFRLIRR
ncbi:hypothetical protein JQC91_02095 [Jannaschia sp. Os4]|uniref:hypothetical protein n=1 Tax=Jannaschia sp. Os4 TaxID=2807617 RepID=UPI00193A57BB|nr:hypothetical protein [Jannaschia sp. Os4]MBM2575085.1 hypothetical protein [Jannaschia sp. Os4]